VLDNGGLVTVPPPIEPELLTSKENLAAGVRGGGWDGLLAGGSAWGRYAWSVATGSSVAWVLIAFIFTLVDSFVSLEFSADDGSEGHAVGTLWLWLLCLVIGWLWVPTFTRGELKSAIGHANKKAAKNSTKRIKQKAAKAYNSAKTKITNRLPKRMSIRKGFKKPVVDLPEVPEENGSEKMKAGLVQVDTKPVWQQTEEKPDPIPNPAHDRSTVSFQEPTESQHGHSHNVSANPTANYSISSLRHSAAIHSFAAPSSIRETDRLLILKDEFNSLHRDELRFSATFNYSRIMRYLTLVDDVLGALDRLAREKEEVGLLRKRLFLEVVTPITDSPQRKRPISEITATHPAEGVVFPPGALRSMFIASIFALILQCGTTAAAIVIMVLTPTFGLGCRSLGYVLYGGISTLILFLTIISTTLARISETRVGPSTTCSVKGITAFVAVALRRVSLLLALTNATGLVVLSCLQFSKVLNTCYCNASVIGQGTGSYTLISFEGWIPTMRTARVSASILAAACMGVYMIFLWLMTALPREIDQF